MAIVSKELALKHYQWGDACDSWNFVDDANLSIKQERMPTKTSENLHYHQFSQQFFFILKGIATFQIGDELIEVNEQEGIHIKAGTKHRIINNTVNDLEFLLSSQPSTENDRININQ